MRHFEFAYKELVEFSDSGDDNNQHQAVEFIRQFLDNVIQIPEEFLDYEKLEVWKKLKTRITDDDVRRDIDEIWTRWTRLLLDRENRNLVEIGHPFSPSYTPSVPYDPGTPVSTAGSSPSVSMTSSPAPSTSFYSPPDAHGRYPPSTPSSSTYALSPYPLTPRTPATPSEDRIVEEIRLTVYNADKRRVGEFKYGVKQSNKVVCLTEDCWMKHSKANKIRNEGITLATLKSHARKDHSIELSIKEKKASLSNPLICEFCSKPYARPQTLKNHIKKHHSNQSQDSRPIDYCNQPTAPSINDDTSIDLIQNISIDPFSDPDAQFQTDGVESLLSGLIAEDPDLGFIIQEFPIVNLGNLNI